MPGNQPSSSLWGLTTQGSDSLNPATQYSPNLSLSAEDGVWLDSAWGGGLSFLSSQLPRPPASCEVPIHLHPWMCGSWVSHWPGRSGTQKDCFNGQGSGLFGRDKVCGRSLMPKAPATGEVVCCDHEDCHRSLSMASLGGLLQLHSRSQFCEDRGPLGWGSQAARPSWGLYLELPAKILTRDH